MKRSASYLKIVAPKTPSKKRKKTTSLTPGFKRIVNGVPPTLKSTLKYAQTITINPSVGGCNGHSFRINSLFDPDFTGIGH